MAVYGSRVAYCVRCRPSVACTVHTLHLQAYLVLDVVKGDGGGGGGGGGLPS